MGTLKNFISSENADKFNTETIFVERKDIDNMNSQNYGTILKPINFSEAGNIADDIIRGKDVVVDLTETNLEEAKRICDFLNGVTYAKGGSVTKVAKLIYIFSPISK